MKMPMDTPNRNVLECLRQIAHTYYMINYDEKNGPSSFWILTMINPTMSQSHCQRTQIRQNNGSSQSMVLPNATV